MPADDLTINVRQIAGYSAVAQASQTMALLVQVAGLGSAYASISPQDLVGTALATGGDMSVGGVLSAQAFMGGSAQFTNAAASILNAQTACILNLNATHGSIGGIPIASIADVAATVTSFNFRNGAVMLELGDIICAGGAPIASPFFWGDPRAPNPAPDSNSNTIATTSWVNSSLATMTLEFAPLDSPNFTGVPTAPTAPLGSTDGQLATTAFVANAIASGVAGVASFNSRTGAVVLTAADIIGAGGAPLASPTFTGVPAAATAALGTSTTQLATTAFVQAAIASGTSGVSSFNTRQGAVTLTTADITGAGGALAASTVASFNGRSGAVNLIANDISAASGALLSSPAFTGLPTAPTPPAADNSTRIATTAFVASMTGFAPIASPAFTGIPTAPTASFGTNTTQLATTAFVEAAVTGSTAGVASFNNRSGAVTFLANDLTAVGGALLASPALTGTPTAPTAPAGTSTTQLATTAFVQGLLTSPAITGNAVITGVAPGPALLVTGVPAGNTSGLQVTGGIQCQNNLTMSPGSSIVPSNFGIQGVTNGSAATAGAVGELAQASLNVNVSWSTNQNGASFTLAAGDWDIWGSFNSNAPQAGNQMTSVFVLINRAGVAQSIYSLSATFPAQAQIAGMIPAFNASLTAATTFTIVTNFGGGGGAGFSVGTTLYARRRR